MRLHVICRQMSFESSCLSLLDGQLRIPVRLSMDIFNSLSSALHESAPLPVTTVPCLSLDLSLQFTVGSRAGIIDIHAVSLADPPWCDSNMVSAGV